MNRETEIEELAPWIVLVITLTGGLLRVLLLANKGLSLDETFSIWIANHRVGEILPWVAKIDHQPPLYYLLLHYWMRLNGDASYNVRMLSVLFGAGTIPIIYLVGKRMSGLTMGFAAAVLLALSPFNVRYAQETGMYTLLTFNAAVAIYALVRLLTDPRSVKPIGSQFREYLHAWRTAGPADPDAQREFSYRDPTKSQAKWRAWLSRHRWLPTQAIETDLAWVAFIVFSAATMLTHNTAILFPLATNIFVLGLMLYQKVKKPGAQATFQAPSFWNWVIAQVGILILWSPWAITFFRQASRVYAEFWIAKPSWEAVVQTFASFLNDATLRLPGQLMLTFWILYALVLGLGLVHYRKNMVQLLFLAALFAIPFLVELVISLRRPIFLDRTLIWTAIPVLLVLAAGITQLKFRFLMLVVLAVFGINNLFSDGDYYRFAQKEEWSNPAGFVANFAQKDDLVLFNGTLGQIPFDYYFRTYEELYFIRVEKHGVPADLFESGIREPKMTDDDVPGLVSLVNGRKRVWLVYSRNQYTDPQGLVPQTLASQMQLVGQRDFNGVQVQFYAAP